jgi:hypothetical protein
VRYVNHADFRDGEVFVKTLLQDKANGAAVAEPRRRGGRSPPGEPLFRDAKLSGLGPFRSFAARPLDHPGAGGAEPSRPLRKAPPLPCYFSTSRSARRMLEYSEN